MSAKVSCTVLRGGESGNARTLPDNEENSGTVSMAPEAITTDYTSGCGIHSLVLVRRCSGKSLSGESRFCKNINLNKFQTSLHIAGVLPLPGEKLAAIALNGKSCYHI